MFAAITGFFSNPTRQAFGWALLGVIGIGLAGGGAILLLGSGGDDDNGGLVADAVRTGTASASGSSSPSSSASASTSATVTPTRIGLTATALALEDLARTQTATLGTPSATATATNTSFAQPTQPQNQQPTPTSAPEPTATPVPPTATSVPAGSYCGDFTGGGVPTFPVQVSGNITRGGAPAGAGLSVSLAFNGVVGMSLTTTAESSFNFRFPVNNAPNCINKFGAGLTVIVDGASFGAGSVSSEPFLLVNVALP